MTDNTQSHEAFFVCRFVRPARKERMLHELLHPDKRERAIFRFSHRAPELLLPQCTHQLPKDIQSVRALQRAYPGIVGAHDTLYAMMAIAAPEAEQDGDILPLSAFFELLWAAPLILVHTGHRYALVMAEPIPVTDRYILF